METGKANKGLAVKCPVHYGEEFGPHPEGYGEPLEDEGRGDQPHISLVYLYTGSMGRV